MRDLLKRLETLEAKAAPKRPFRCMVRFIESDNGKALPFDPNTAECRSTRQTLQRLEGESVEDFRGRTESLPGPVVLLYFQDHQSPAAPLREDARSAGHRAGSSILAKR